MTGEKRTETRCTLEHDVIMGVPICNQTCTLLKNNPHMVKNLWGQIFGLDIGMTACIVYDCREGRGGNTQSVIASMLQIQSMWLVDLQRYCNWFKKVDRVSDSCACAL